MTKGFGVLAAAVVARMTFHALYLPAFEGPDEPQHLARVMDFARRPLGEAFQGKWVDSDLVASVLAHPCPHPELGCPPYAGNSGLFDLLRKWPPSARAVARIPNEEAKQPPLFYLLAGLALRPLGSRLDPAAALLLLRLLSVAFVAVALFGPLWRLFRGSPTLAIVGLVAMLSPGASEALARCSNDAALFLWAAATLASLEGRPGTLRIASLLAAGPLIKLTAWPVSAFAIVCLWRQGRRAAAAAGGVASSLVVPVQALRGWATGGALELQRQRPLIDEPLAAILLGLARTAYTLVKAPFWAMGWSLLAPPPALVASYLGVLISAILALRIRSKPRRISAHAIAAAAAVAGSAMFAVATRRYFGVWGGVTGWYVWGWSPWLAVGARDLLRLAPGWCRPLLAAEALFVLAANAVWFAQSGAAYGG